MDGGAGDCPRDRRNPPIIVSRTASQRKPRGVERAEARKRSRDEATAFMRVVSPVVVSPAGPHVLPRRVRLQVSRVPHARHTVVLYVEPDSYHTPAAWLSQWPARLCASHSLERRSLAETCGACGAENREQKGGGHHTPRAIRMVIKTKWLLNLIVGSC